ncbi:MAG: TetR/AcrR family transcriptional regulator [Actinomycetota bacterium]
MRKDEARTTTTTSVRGEATRRRLIERGRVAFAELGHDGVSLHRDVLGPAGVSNGSFYHQFTDKTDLLLAVLEDAEGAGRFVLADAAEPTPDAGPVALVRRAFETWFQLVDGAEDLFRIQLRERSNTDPRVQAAVEAVRERWVDTVATQLRRARTDLDAGQAARVLSSLTSGLLLDYLATDPADRATFRAERLETVPAFVVAGLDGLADRD